jgi:hypothetical protein
VTSGAGLRPGLPLTAADLKDVRIVSREVQSETSFHRHKPVILDVQWLVADPLPEKLLQREVQCAERHPHQAVMEEVRVGQGDGQLIVLVPDRRPQKNGRLPSTSSNRQER